MQELQTPIPKVANLNEFPPPDLASEERANLAIYITL